MYVVIAECGAARQIVTDPVNTHLEARVKAREYNENRNCTIIEYSAMALVRAEKLGIPVAN